MNHEQPRLRFLAISGSLRAASSNTVLLRAAVALAPSDVEITLYDGLGELPYFNPDLDSESPPPSVVEFRSRLQAADGVLICSPEYAHGVPGVLKNALDWIMSSGELMHKPVALLNASFAATHAHTSLWETLSVMMAQIVPEASLRVPLTTNKIDEATVLANNKLTGTLRKALAALEHTTILGLTQRAPL